VVSSLEVLVNYLSLDFWHLVRCFRTLVARLTGSMSFATLGRYPLTIPRRIVGQVHDA